MIVRCIVKMISIRKLRIIPLLYSTLYDLILSMILNSKKLPKNWNDSMSFLSQLLAYDTVAKYIIVGCDINRN